MPPLDLKVLLGSTYRFERLHVPDPPPPIPVLFLRVPLLDFEMVRGGCDGGVGAAGGGAAACVSLGAAVAAVAAPEAGAECSEL